MGESLGLLSAVDLQVDAGAGGTLTAPHVPHPLLLTPMPRENSRLPLWRDRALLWQMARREIEQQTRGSVLGRLWIGLEPLLMLGVFTVVFGMILQGDFGVSEHPGPFDYPLGIFAGLAILNLITGVMGISTQVILGHKNLVQKVVFPLEILPIVGAAPSLLRFIASLVLYILGLLLSGHGLSVYALWLPLIIAPVILLAVGLAWLLAALGTFFRDLAPTVGFLSLVLFYASAVFYPPDLIPEPIYAWLRFNPILQAVVLWREATLWDQPVSLLALGYLWGCGLALALLGYTFFRKLQTSFADVI